MAHSVLIWSAVVVLTISDSEIIPLNIAVLEQQKMQMNCGSISTTSIQRCIWKYSINYITMKETVFSETETAEQFSRFNVIPSPGRCDLHLETVRISDAGIYNCSWYNPSNVATTRSAQLIVLVSDPQCQMILNGTQSDLTEDDIVQMQCTVKLKGNWVPTVQWKHSGNDSAVSEKMHEDNSSICLSSKLQLKLHSDHNGATVASETFFKNLTNFPKDYAINIPLYNYTWISPSLNVSYGPQNVLIYPSKHIYNPADIISCSAAGNPQPDYFWTDIDRQVVVSNDSMIVISKDMVSEKVYKFKCVASVKIGSRDEKKAEKPFEFKVENHDDFQLVLIVGTLVAVCSVAITVFVTIRVALSLKALKKSKEDEKENPEIESNSPSTEQHDKVSNNDCVVYAEVNLSNRHPADYDYNNFGKGTNAAVIYSTVNKTGACGGLPIRNILENPGNENNGIYAYATSVSPRATPATKEGKEGACSSAQYLNSIMVEDNETNTSDDVPPNSYVGVDGTIYADLSPSSGTRNNFQNPPIPPKLRDNRIKP